MQKLCRKLFAIFIIFACSLTVDAEPLKVSLPEADKTMVLDGVFNENCYRNIKWYPLNGGKDTVVQKTLFTVLRGKTGLYFSFKAADREIVCNKKEDDGALWADDSLEIFLMPEHAVPEDPNTREFYHFIFNVENFRYDARIFGGVSHKSWNSRWKTCVRRTADGFDAEVFIPYSGISFRRGEKDWRFNVGREDRLEKKTCLSQFCAGLTFNDCNSFALLENAAPDQVRYDVMLISRNIGIESKSAVPHPVLEASFQTLLTDQEIFCTVAVRTENKKLIALSNSIGKTSKDGKLEIKIALPSEVKGDCTFEIFLADKEGTFFEDKFRRYVDTAPIQLRFLNPVYRSTLFATQKNQNISFEVILQNGVCRNIKSELCDSSGNVLQTANKDISKRHIFKFPAEKLVPGNYMIRISDGKTTIQEPVRVLERQVGNEVILDADGKLLVNGSRFFPRGFIGGGTDLTPFTVGKCNTVHFYELHRFDIKDIRTELDRCRQLNLKVIMTPLYKTNVGFWGVKSGSKYRQKFTDQELENFEFMVNSLKGHPALLAWYLYDEPRGAAWEAELKKIYERLLVLDPAHPVLGLDNVASGVIDKIDHCDIAVLDIYSNAFVRSGPARPISMIAASTSTVIRSMPPGKALWQCPQAYDNDSFQSPDFVRERRAPNYTETRATVFGCIASGANGILPYKIGNPVCKYFVRNGNAGIFADPELKLGYLEGIMPELANLEKVLLADEFSISFSGNVKLRAFKYGKHCFIIAANVETVPTELTMQLEKTDFLRVLGEKRRITAGEKGLFKDKFAPLAVHIYTDSPDFPEAVDVEALKKKIAAERKAALDSLPENIKNKQ